LSLQLPPNEITRQTGSSDFAFTDNVKNKAMSLVPGSLDPIYPALTFQQKLI
jgi:hypothetical protein